MCTPHSPLCSTLRLKREGPNPHPVPSGGALLLGRPSQLKLDGVFSRLDLNVFRYWEVDGATLDRLVANVVARRALDLHFGPTLGGLAWRFGRRARLGIPGGNLKSRLSLAARGFSS